MINGKIKTALAEFIKKDFGIELEPQLSRPNPGFGDLATNVAMQIAARAGQPPAQIAQKIAEHIASLDGIAKAEVAGGFVNIRLDAKALAQMVEAANELPKPRAGQEILVEFGDPNPFKEMHIGHAYSYIVGDAISSLLEVAGAKVHRLSYHGDVGLHVAKAIWGMQKEGVDPQEITDALKFHIGHYYALGAQAYESDAAAKIDIDHLNQHIYQGTGNTSQLYEWGRTKSLARFELILGDLRVAKPKQFFESQAAKIGAELVEQNEGKVFEKSEGAIVYKGEKAGLHTRVFITSAGLPTYEAKDLGLAILKDKDYPGASRSLIVTAHEQAEYFKVMLAALGEINSSLADKTKHLYHGFVSLSSGKMSSRTGDVYSATSLIADVNEAVKKVFGSDSESTRNAAIKYGFLKHRLGSDIVYDVAESVSLEGNSGPYLQYAHARARSVLAKVQPAASLADLEDSERELALKISQFSEVFASAVHELAPHHVCSYLYELAQTFNSFYEKNRVVGDPREGQRAKLVELYADVLKAGLKLLNIEAPEKI